MLRVCFVFSIWLAAAWPVLCLAEPREPAARASAGPRQIQRWIGQLEAEAFKTREQATADLIHSGAAAVGAVSVAAINGPPETRWRAMQVLLTVFQSVQIDSFPSARQALLEVASSRNHALARRARDVLVRHEQSSLKTLRKLGAVVILHNREVVLGGKNWSGGGDGLVHLNGLMRIDRLKIWQAKIDDDALSYLQNLIHVEELWLADTRITDRGLSKLSRMTRLKVLDLRYTDVGDAGMRCFNQWPDLERLNLAHTQITDRGLEHLRALRQLQRLDLSNTDVSTAGVEQLKRRLPGLRVVY